jgi:hypothetical protein
MKNKEEIKWDRTIVKKLKKLWKSWWEIKERTFSDWKINLTEFRKIKYLKDIENISLFWEWKFKIEWIFFWSRLIVSKCSEIYLKLCKNKNGHLKDKEQLLGWNEGK